MNAAKASHIGSDFDDFLGEEGRLEEAAAVAVKRVVASQIANAMKTQGTKRDMAKRRITSRAALDRLLNEDDPGLTLATLMRAAQVLGRGVKFELTARA